MATLDVNDAFDPSFLDSVLVNRATETIDAHGRVNTSAVQLSAQAVVVPTSPDDLQRLPEEEYMNKAITLYSATFRFQGSAQDPISGVRQKPDHVVWHGSTYVVRLVDDYAGFGRGFVQAVAVSVEAVDPPPPVFMGRA